MRKKLLTQEQAIKRLLAVIELEAGGSRTGWAKLKGMSPTLVIETIQGKRDPAGKILPHLGLKRIFMYEEK